MEKAKLTSIANSAQYYSAFGNPEYNLKGNPAAVVFLIEPLSNEEMQAVAAFLNQPATSFLWQDANPNNYHIRWFAPMAEIGLCGHGSLAAAGAVFDSIGIDQVSFLFEHGEIAVSITSQDARLSFAPIDCDAPEKVPDCIARGFNSIPTAYFRNINKGVVLFQNAQDVEDLKPDFDQLATCEPFGLIATAPGHDGFDFVSRTFLPKINIEDHEDPATGSSHVVLTRFWQKRLMKSKLKARQLSKLGGYFECEDHGTQIFLSGRYISR